MYVRTIATISNSLGQSIDVEGPTVRAETELTGAWKRTYRPVVLDIAAEREFVTTGAAIAWRKVYAERFTPAAEIPTDAVLVTWFDTADGEHEHVFHRTQRAARAAHAKDGKRAGIRTHGWKLIEKSDREHGIMVW